MSNNIQKIVWVGRFTGPKGEFAEQMLQQVVPHFPDCQFTFVGGPVSETITASAPSNASFSDFVTDINAVYQQNDLVIGAGRVVIEAMRLQKPVIAVGESEYIGPVNQENIARALATNFGDCAPGREFNIAQLKKDIDGLLKGKIRLDTGAYESMLHVFDPEYVHQQVQHIYRIASATRYLKQFREIPVLMYHRVVREPVRDSKFGIYITRDDLDTQLASLKQRGFTALTFSDVLQGQQPDKPVFLTFDDGYQDNHDNLLPLLEKHDMKATVYVLANRELNKNEWDIPKGEPAAPLMDDRMIRTCHGSGRIEIGSHGLNHLHLPELNSAELEQEVANSKAILEDLTGDTIHSFAYPYGDYSDREATQVADAGYDFGIGTVNGPLAMSEDRFRIRRINMFSNTSKVAFWKKTSGFYLRYCKLKGKDF